MTTDPNLPPRQRLAAPGKWPIVGERTPLPWEPPWRLTLTQEGVPLATWTLDELQAMRAETATVDFHCVTRWSRRDVRVTGISLETLLVDGRFDIPRPFDYISFVARTERAHSSSIPLGDAVAHCAMLVWEVDGKPLPVEHGGPLRSIVPGKYFYKSVKWVERIDLLSVDRLGYWEAEAGYHNGADPWLEQRYVAEGLSRDELRGLLATRDWSGREALNLIAEGRDLSGLVARGAVLRNADFRKAGLASADFSAANLSNASFAGADLRGASFRGADVEGAEFDGADLDGADFRGASLFGATFSNAKVDARTAFDRERLEALADPERRFLREALQRAGAADDETDEDRERP